MATPSNHPLPYPGRWLRWSAQALLILLTAAMMLAVLLPVFKGVSKDSRPRDMMGLPIGEKPKTAPLKK